MSFDLNAWQDSAAEKLHRIGGWLDRRKTAEAPFLVADQRWFTQTLHGELSRLGNLSHFQATLLGSGSIAQGPGAKSAGAGGVVAETIQGSVTTTYIEKQQVYQAAPPPPADQARTQYLKRLRQRCNVLPLAALGGEEETGEEVSLDRVYVALDTRTLAPQSEEDSARRSASLPGREENWPLAAMEAATQATRLVLLGDAGSGKSTFVRQLTAMLSTTTSRLKLCGMLCEE